VAPVTEVCVAHLVWGPLGLGPVEDFAAAYRRHAAGCAHRLVVGFNGVAGAAERARLEAPFAGVAHDTFAMPAPTQDIPVYIAAARRDPADYVCCLNSYSTPLADGWLAALLSEADRPGIGLVGATGSWESYYSAALGAAERPPHVPSPRRWAGWAVRAARRTVRAARLAPHEVPFPNPHIRSNAFMLRRDLFLSLRAGPLATKRDAERFESGRRGMTRQVLARGLAVRVVGRDGVGYAPADWFGSRTFRSGSQENLLIADNRTRQYAEADAATRARLAELAWGAGAASGARP
jgi:hypothetical protein